MNGMLIMDGRRNPEDNAQRTFKLEPCGIMTRSGNFLAPMCPRCITSPTSVTTTVRPRVFACACRRCQIELAVYYDKTGQVAHCFRSDELPADYRRSLIVFSREQLGETAISAYGFGPVPPVTDPRAAPG